MRGVGALERGADETVGAAGCTYLHGHADLTRAVGQVPHGMPIPPDTDRYGELLRVPIELWIDDDEHIRRVRQRNELATLTLELTELGAVPPADWSRLPTFRSPEEAATLERHGL